MSWFTKAVAASCFLLLVAGGLVTSTGSSLAVPDWPLSFGQAMPPMVGGVAFEHGHRMIAAFVAVLVWLQAAWLYRAEARPWVRRLGYAAAAGVLLQALLGGATVLLRLPPPVSIAHACLGQAVFCLLVAVAAASSPRTEGGDWRLGALAFIAAYIQLALGAFLRHTGSGLWLHVGWAAVVFAAVLAASRPLALLVAGQLFLGYRAYLARYAPEFASGFSAAAALTASHLAVGALILATLVVRTMRTRPA